MKYIIVLAILILSMYLILTGCNNPAPSMSNQADAKPYDCKNMSVESGFTRGQLFSSKPPKETAVLHFWGSSSDSAYNKRGGFFIIEYTVLDKEVLGIMDPLWEIKKALDNSGCDRGDATSFYDSLYSLLPKNRAHVWSYYFIPGPMDADGIYRNFKFKKK